MIAPLVNRPDGVVCATLAVSLVTGPHREGKRATPPLGRWRLLNNGGISNFGTTGLSGCSFAADPAHPVRHQFRTSGGAVG